jgi:hypothetical protein
MTETAALEMPLPPDGLTFVAISADGSTVVVASTINDLYLFQRPAGGWVSTATSIHLTSARNDATNALYGRVFPRLDVSANGDTLLSGAFLFVRPTAGWANGSSVASLLIVGGTSAEPVHLAMSSDGRTIVQDAGAIYLRPAGGWSGTVAASAMLSLSTNEPDPLSYAQNIAISADGTRVVRFVNRAAFYVYDRPSGGWVHATESERIPLRNFADIEIRLGIAIDAAGTTLLVHERLSTGPNATEVYRLVPSATASFAPSADARARKLAPNTRYGSSAILGVDGADDPKETYLRFRVSGLAGGVRRATLRLYATIHNSDNGPGLYTASNDWDERTISWNNRPSQIGSLIANVGAVAARSWVEYDVTSLVTGDGNYSLALVAESTRSVDFSAREGANPPQLVIVTAP